MEMTGKFHALVTLPFVKLSSSFGMDTGYVSGLVWALRAKELNLCRESNSDFSVVHLSLLSTTNACGISAVRL
jgi:hypothetical protein